MERGEIRLIAQGCTCAFCPSVSTERWFDTRSVWLFENSLIHPLAKQKSTSCDVLCYFGVDSLNSDACKFTCISERAHRKVVRCALRTVVFSLKKPQKSTLSQNKTAHLTMCCFVGGEGWIRTTEVTDNRFTVCSLWPLGNLSVWSW